MLRTRKDVMNKILSIIEKCEKGTCYFTEYERDIILTWCYASYDKFSIGDKEACKKLFDLTFKLGKTNDKKN